jgi:putative ABC transport system permease protein
MPTHLSIALRMLAARPWLTAGRLVTVTLVVTAASAVFTVANATLLHPLPFPDPDRLVRVFLQPPGTTDFADANPLDPFEFVRFRGHVRLLDRIEGIWAADRAVVFDAEPDSIPAGRVSAGFFDLLGARMILGRAFSEQESLSGARVVVLGEGLWMRGFGGDRGIVGRTVTVDREPHTIVGVVAAGFEPAFTATELWTPLTIAPAAPPALLTSVQTIGRMREGASLEQARTELEQLIDAMRSEAPSVLNGWTIGLRDLRDARFGSRRPATLMLLTAVAVLALIAIANLANLTLADVTFRRGDFALRAALGGSRSQIAAPEVVQALVLAMSGGIAGLTTAAWLLPALLALDPSSAFSGERLTTDWRVGGAGLGAALTVMLAAVVVPVIRVAGPALASDLSGGGRRIVGGPAAQRIRIILVSAQTALAVVLLSTGGLVMMTLYRTTRLNPGFDATHVVAAQLRLSATVLPTVASRAAFLQQVLDRLAATPGVTGAAVTLNPFRVGESFQTLIQIEDHPSPDGQPHTVQFRRISPGYFNAMRIPLLRGRAFDGHDTADAAAVVLISRSCARRFWPDADPIGRRIKRGSSATTWSTVVGVVDDVRDSGLDQPLRDTVYASYFQGSNAAAPVALVVRTASAPGGLVPAIRRAVWAVDPKQPLGQITTLETFLDASIGPSRFRALLIAVCGALGLLLATIGTYGIAARAVVERRKEVAIRLALGGRVARVCWAVVRGPLRAVLTGAVAGIVGSGLAHAVVQAVLPDVNADGWRFTAAATGVLIVAGMGAAAVAARRAASVDPVRAMQGE